MLKRRDLALIDQVMKGARWQRLVEKTVKPLSAHDKFRVINTLAFDCLSAHATLYTPIVRIRLQ